MCSSFNLFGYAFCFYMISCYMCGLSKYQLLNGKEIIHQRIWEFFERFLLRCL